MSQVRPIHPPSSSRPGSVFSSASIDTLVADKGYRGFPSQEAYLQALREWVEEKMYYNAPDGLHGFYGQKTVDDILDSQGGKVPKSRRATVTRLNPVKEDEAAPLTGVTTPAPGSKPRKTSEDKGSKLKKVFSRRRSAA